MFKMRFAQLSILSTTPIRLLALLFVVVVTQMPAVSMSEDSKPSDGMSFAEQCPKLFAIADDFAHDCLEKALTHKYEAFIDSTRHKTTISGTIYFRPTDPQSHFSLGCVLNNREKDKIDFLGIYYAAKGANFALADTDKAEFRNIDTSRGHVGLIAGGEPMNLVLVAAGFYSYIQILKILHCFRNGS
jgi:hypothetical protein